MNKAIAIDGLSVGYGAAEVLSDVSFSVAEGEFLGIIGPNGGGKTTLLRSILGLIPAKRGSIEIFGKPAAKNRAILGYVPQFASFDRRFPITVGEVVCTALLGGGLHPFFRFGKGQLDKAEDYLEMVDLGGFSKRPVSDLSGGEFQRLLLARALAREPRILLLDEPTASVDPGTRAKIYALLTGLNKGGMTVLMVTHDLLAVSSAISSLACLSHTLVYHGEPELDERVSTAMYGCPVDLIAHGVPHRVLRSHGGEGGCCHD